MADRAGEIIYGKDAIGNKYRYIIAPKYPGIWDDKVKAFKILVKQLTLIR